MLQQEAPWRMDYGDAVATASNALLASYEDALQREKLGLPPRGVPTAEQSPWLSLRSQPAWPHEQRADPQLEANFGAPRSSHFDSHVATGRHLQALQDKQDKLLAELVEVKSLILRRDGEMEALHHEVAALLRRSVHSLSRAPLSRSGNPDNASDDLTGLLSWAAKSHSGAAECTRSFARNEGELQRILERQPELLAQHSFGNVGAERICGEEHAIKERTATATRRR